MRSRLFCVRPLLLLIVPVALLLLLTLPGLPWSSYCRYKLRRAETKAAIGISKLRGYEPRLVSISGECGLPGARIQAVDSKTGWASVADANGNFLLPGLLWYRGATYDLVFSTDDRTARTARVSLLEPNPTREAISVGRISLSGSYTVLYDLRGLNSPARLPYDFNNRDYYRTLYDALTFGIIDDKRKIDTVNRFVAERLNQRNKRWEIGSPRRVLEEGSLYCGHLSEALASILAVGYRTRIVDMTDTSDPPNTHVVVEVFYRDEWHLFDPTFGVRFEKPDGGVASYTDIRLDPEIVSPASFATFRNRFPRVSLGWIQGVYTSGSHHLSEYCFKCSQYSHAWWVYPDGLDYVQSGSTITLAAAGIRPGTSVTYHIKPEGGGEDVAVLTTRTKANRQCVLNQEESPPISLSAGRYDVVVDLEDGNVPPAQGGSSAVLNWRLSKKLEVR